MKSVDDVREIKFDLEPEIKTAIEEEQVAKKQQVNQIEFNNC